MSRKQRSAARAALRERYAREVGERLCVTRIALWKLDRCPKLQRDFAKSLGLQKTTYSQYEVGDNLLPPDVAREILLRYGVSLDWLYAGAFSTLPSLLYEKILNERERLKRP